MSYVDGFLLAVPNDRLDEYKALAIKSSTVWMEHGAIGYVEATADDVPYGELTSFPRAVMAKDNETVVFAYAAYPSRQVRDEVMKKVMEDERMKGDMDKMPFDGKRMIWGGYDVIVEPDSWDASSIGYLDGFVLPVETARMDDYRRIVRQSAPLWKEIGALSVVESVAEDVPHGELTSFPRGVQANDEETTGFAFITYDSRETRDAANTKMMSDDGFESMMRDMPTDGKRMIFGGFKPFVAI